MNIIAKQAIDQSKEIQFSARCPFCLKQHHHFELVSDSSGRVLPVRTATHHFSCCGHEIGFSIRRLWVPTDATAVMP